MTIMDDRALLLLAGHVGIDLIQQGLMLASAESCTGGWLGQAITSKRGSSAWYERGFITYSVVSKQEMLGVSAATLKQHGTVSEQTAQEMAAGAISHSRAQVAVAITGIAGPDGGTAEKPAQLPRLPLHFPRQLRRHPHRNHRNHQRQQQSRPQQDDRLLHQRLRIRIQHLLRESAPILA